MPLSHSNPLDRLESGDQEACGAPFLPFSAGLEQENTSTAFLCGPPFPISNNSPSSPSSGTRGSEPVFLISWGTLTELNEKELSRGSKRQEKHQTGGRPNSVGVSHSESQRDEGNPGSPGFQELPSVRSLKTLRMMSNTLQ